MNSVILEGKEILYEIKTSERALRLGLTVYPGGRLVVTLPRRAKVLNIDGFLERHKHWLVSTIRRFANKKKLPGGIKDYRENRQKAQTMLTERLEHFNRHYRFAYNRISIRDTKTRWGSCSRKGNLNFSYKLMHLTPELRDYVVVHELCHLKYFDHSEKFWSLVAQTFPNYKDLRRELRSFVH